MKRIIIIGFISLFLNSCFGQKILILENIRSLKNFKYLPGQSIQIQLSDEKGKFTDELADMTDSSLILSNHGEILFKEVYAIYKDNWLIGILQGLSLLGGAAYFSIDSFNRLINHEDPVIQTETLLISGSLVAFSFALLPWRDRKFSIGQKWKLKVIDMSVF